jgi:hypothetical protein
MPADRRIIAEMAARRFNEPIEPITLGNMRANGVRSLDVSCWQGQPAHETLTGVQWR